jgi:hypothetical protein
MVSQALFGEHFSIIEKSGNWVKIKLHNDSYEGWIDAKLYIEITQENFMEFKQSEKVITAELLSKVTSHLDSFFIPMGSQLPFYLNQKLKIGEMEFKYNGTISPQLYDEEAFIKKAKSFLKSPYLWGGKTLFGIDCSGFTQIVMAQFGINLMRDAYLQATQGELVSFVSEARTGDLAFFDNEEGKITHVGILLADFQIIHAHGEVRIDTLDDGGIFNKKTGKHSHRLRFVKRFLTF